MAKRGLLFILVVVLALVGYWVLLPHAESESSLGESVSTAIPVVVDDRQDSVDQTEDTDEGHALDPLIEIARSLLEKYQADVRDYTASMVKRERISGTLGAETRMNIKVRCRGGTAEQPVPLAVYLEFTEPSSTAGREVIWIEGQRDNKIYSHEGGFKNWTTLQLDPDGMLAMLGNKYPITEVGLRRMIEKLIEKGEQDRQVGPCVVNTIKDQTVGGRPCTLYQIVHPEKDERFDFHIAQVFVDDQLQIPLRYAAFMWPESEGGEPVLEEEYTFLDIKLNVGLTDNDFDPENSEYKFP